MVFWDVKQCSLASVYQTAWCHISEECNLHIEYCQNLRCLTVSCFYVCVFLPFITLKSIIHKTWYGHHTHRNAFLFYCLQHYKHDSCTPYNSNIPINFFFLKFCVVVCIVKGFKSFVGMLNNSMKPLTEETTNHKYMYWILVKNSCLESRAYDDKVILKWLFWN
jgi:hypothetical protein